MRAIKLQFLEALGVVDERLYCLFRETLACGIGYRNILFRGRTFLLVSYHYKEAAASRHCHGIYVGHGNARFHWGPDDAVPWTSGGIHWADLYQRK